MGWLAQPLPTSSRAGPTQRGASTAWLNTFPENKALCSRVVPETPKPMWTQAMPSMGLGSSGSCLHPPPLEQRFCSLPPGLAAGVGARVRGHAEAQGELSPSLPTARQQQPGPAGVVPCVQPKVVRP